MYNWDRCSEQCTIFWQTLWWSLAFFHELLRLEIISGKHILDYLHSQERAHLTPEHFHVWCFLWAPFAVRAQDRCALTPVNLSSGTAGPNAGGPWVTAVPSASHGAAGHTWLYHLKGLGSMSRKAAWWHIYLLWLYCTELKKRGFFHLTTLVLCGCTLLSAPFLTVGLNSQCCFVLLALYKTTGHFASPKSVEFEQFSAKILARKHWRDKWTSEYLFSGICARSCHRAG